MTTGAQAARHAAPSSLKDWALVLRQAGMTIVRSAAIIVTLFLLMAVRGDVSIYFQVVAVAISTTLLFVAFGRSARPWAFYVALFVLFAQLRAHADEIGTPVQSDYVITLEKAMFLGKLPMITLQDAFYTYPRLGVLEAYTMAVYLSYFIAPHIVALALWKWDRQRFRLFAPAFLLTLYIGLLVSALLPTAPPWMASEAGKIPTVYQIVPDILNHQVPGAYEAGENSAGTNAVAAMPSLHSGVPWLMTMALWKYRRVRWAAFWYAASMSFAVVYLGEHYFVDALAGLLTAAVAWLSARRLVAWWDGHKAISVATEAPVVTRPEGASGAV